MSQLSDEDIMVNVSKGDLDQMRYLFHRYHLRIYNFFQKMVRNRAVSEDLTQDVFTKVIRYRSSYNHGNFASWIFTIARNIFSTYYQKQKKERNYLMNDDLIDSGEILIPESNQDELNHLQKALLKLSNTDRELIVMHRFQKIQYEQIAEITGSSEGAVKMKVHRALKKLKDIYFQTG